MNAKFENNLMVFENERYVTEMTITSKGEGHDRGEPRLRCAVSIKLQAKETENELNLRANIYWDAKYPKTHLFFTGGSLVEFIGQQGDDYSQFKTEYWDKVKRLSANAFTDEEVLEYQKMMSASKV
ncbi:hypothetical protein GPDM_01070 [Planococcus donghaensis MPA1U2]|uniref:Uncharacterized protein n=1 Tax=Planococcus donghaensis MPA1U2 TaxID=933115 RepID=E7RCQ0_9BACL|nr:hypothetical protein [Planococcus donghaensis]EGA91415.1 hypothetical protein GPDM_01070 [Planococcus donghaensis MPA1U2]